MQHLLLMKQFSTSRLHISQCAHLPHKESKASSEMDIPTVFAADNKSINANPIHECDISKALDSKSKRRLFRQSSLNRIVVIKAHLYSQAADPSGSAF
jgi:hypothetical protein